MPESIDIIPNSFKSQTASAVLVEFNLNPPTSKTKSKQILFTLLTSLNINDEYDINSINYLNSFDFASISSSDFFSQNNSNSLVQKISIQFKCPNAATRFYDHINSDDISVENRFSNIVKTILDLNDDFLFENSAKHSLSDSIFIFPDDSDARNQLFNTDNTIKENFIEINDSSLVMSYANSLASNQKNKQDLHNSLVSTTEMHNINNTNLYQKQESISRSISISSDIEHLSFEDDLEANQVNIFSLKPIKKQDLEAILLLFENPKRSGGGEIVSHELHQNNHYLKITYYKNLAKKRVIERSLHQYKKYNLIAIDSTSSSSCNLKNQILDRKTIILKNIPNECDMETLRLYCEYLVINDNELNDVDKIECSQIFKNTYYVKFQLDYDYEKLIERVKRKKLKSKSIELMQTFDTNMILIKLKQRLNFDNNENLSLRQINDSVYLTIGSKEIFSNLIEDEKEYSFEYLLNSDLLMGEFIESYEKECDETFKSLDDTTIRDNSSDVLNDFNFNNLAKQVQIRLDPILNYSKIKISQIGDQASFSFRDGLLEQFYIKYKKFFILFLMILMFVVNARIFYVISFANNNDKIEKLNAFYHGKQYFDDRNDHFFTTQSQSYQHLYLTSGYYSHNKNFCIKKNLTVKKNIQQQNKSSTIFVNNYTTANSASNIDVTDHFLNATNAVINEEPIKNNKKKSKQPKRSKSKKLKTLLKYSLDKLLRNGHKDIITSLVALTNGFIASGSYDKTIKIWDTKKGSLKYTFDSNNGGHNGPVWSMVSLKNGYLASGSLDFTIKIWNVQSGALKYTFDKVKGGHSKAISSLVALPNDSLASGSWDSKIKVWDIKNGNLNFTLEDNSSTSYISTGKTSVKNESPISHLAFLKNNNYLASGYDDSKIKIWDLSRKKLKYILEAHTKSISALVPLSNGFLASSSYDNTIKIWNTNSGLLKYSFDENNRGHTDHVTSLVPISQECLASGSDDSTIKIWNVTKGNLKYTINNEYDYGHTQPITALTVLPAKNLLISGSEDSTIKVWEMVNINDEISANIDIRLKQTLDAETSQGHNWTVNNLLVFSSSHLASGSWDSCVKIWNLN